MNIQIEASAVTVTLTPAELAIVSQALEAGYDNAGADPGLISELRFALHNSLANCFRAALEGCIYKMHCDFRSADNAKADLFELTGELDENEVTFIPDTAPTTENDTQE